jgi:hypothetical protein
MAANINNTERNDLYEIKKLYDLYNFIVDPLIFYLIYLIWKANGKNMLKISALTSIKCIRHFSLLHKIANAFVYQLANNEKLLSI